MSEDEDWGAEGALFRWTRLAPGLGCWVLGWKELVCWCWAGHTKILVGHAARCGALRNPAGGGRFFGAIEDREGTRMHATTGLGPAETGERGDINIPLFAADSSSKSSPTRVGIVRRVGSWMRRFRGEQYGRRVDGQGRGMMVRSLKGVRILVQQVRSTNSALVVG